MNSYQVIQWVALVISILCLVLDWSAKEEGAGSREARCSELASDDLRCPYCHEVFQSEEFASERSQCRLCLSEHHRDCFLENERCAVFACGSEDISMDLAKDVKDAVEVDRDSSAG